MNDLKNRMISQMDESQKLNYLRMRRKMVKIHPSLMSGSGKLLYHLHQILRNIFVGD